MFVVTGRLNCENVARADQNEVAFHVGNCAI